MMKKNVMLWTMALALCAMPAAATKTNVSTSSMELTEAKEQPYTINVKLDKKLYNYTEAKAVLRICGEDSTMTILTAPVSSDDTWITATLQGKIDGSRIAYLTLDGHDRTAVSFILEPGTINIRSEKAEKMYFIVASGSPLNDRMVQYNEDARKATSAIDEKIAQLRANKTLTDVERGQQYGDLLAEQQEVQAKVTEQYIKENSKNALSGLLYLDDYSIRQNNLERAERFWKLISPEVQAYKEVADRYARAVAFNTVKEGDQFRDFTLAKGTVDGKQAKLSDFVGRGKYILVDFWASWCTACRLSIPDVKAVYAALQGEPFDCISIATWDKRPAALRAIKEEAMPWTQLIDEEGLSSRTYGISAIPRIILFSPEGKIIRLNFQRGEIIPAITDIVKNRK